MLAPDEKLVPARKLKKGQYIAIGEWFYLINDAIHSGNHIIIKLRANHRSRFKILEIRDSDKVIIKK